MKTTSKQILATIIVMILITFALIWLETYKRQREQFNLAETYYSEKDFPKAIQGYDSAIHMYTPWSSRVKISAEKLWTIGMMFEDQNDYDMALNAYRSLRSSFYAVRWLIQPYQEWIDKCDTAIARVIKTREQSGNEPETSPADNQLSQ